ncbi:hypothetical protein BZA05DRAFT_403437 [Tricharina praecox]|uniref:uncharacterized protein n=1 Tax=Tricharina praecox TaxID=43433 RepID=UPI00222077F0|nr:uncharacterized protein BZA05DRAFT_403437 [Tricharina praecox]KAI5848244.1 hypothetical protein BZA05DRAFT_403437 [Tricharina praecox]
MISRMRLALRRHRHVIAWLIASINVAATGSICNPSFGYGHPSVRRCLTGSLGNSALVVSGCSHQGRNSLPILGSGGRYSTGEVGTRSCQ